ncbi:MAG: alpha/beta hydrolase family protein [Candidatus Sedimenticola sp. (ex Thyasira tokunagai)]
MVGLSASRFRMLYLAGFLWNILILPEAAAEAVVLEVSPGIMATAEFQQGEADSPVILILHGFLQTREFPTVVALGESLAESGMTVLRPTLSLGINRRDKSQACEAIHLHSMEMDTREVAAWVEWLHQRTGRNVTLVGHSAGSTQLLSYLSTAQAPPVDSAILISLSYFGPGRAANESPEHAALAGERLSRGALGPAEYGLDFCPNYVTSPAEYLSYYGWDKQRTLVSLEGLSIDTTVIIGEADQRIDTGWIGILRERGVKLVSVEGANHFFVQQHEFDLLDLVERILTQGEG